MIVLPGALDGALVCDGMMPWGLGGEAGRAPALERLRRAGYDLVSLTLAHDPLDPPQALAVVAAQRRTILARPELLLVETAEDILAARGQGRLGITFNFQGTTPIGRELDLVDAWQALGVRQMLLAYNARNAVADGCHEVGDGGLSHFGAALVRRMQEVGVLLDLSHTGYRSSMEALEMTRRPAVFSHSNPRSVLDHPRNLQDDQMRACAASGGLIGINGMGLLLGDPACATESLLRAVRTVADLVGPAYVGLGLDFVYDVPFMEAAVAGGAPGLWPADGGYRAAPLTFAQPEQVAELAECLQREGWAETDLRGLLGENWLRVWRQAWGPLDPGG